MPEQILIEFISDISQLAPAVDQLEQMGKVEKATADQFRAANKTIQDQGRVMKMTADEFKRSGLTLEQLASKVKKSSSETASLVNIEKALKTELGKVATEVKNTSDALSKQDKVLKDNTTSTLALRSQLRQMIEQLAQMKVAGQDNTEQYRLLAQQAGKLKDAIGDANQEVKNFGSDTSTLDGVISLAGGIAGGFAVVQGAAALFGDESEELQKTLLRVNAAMAILQGLQQVQVLLQKESAAATLANTISLKLFNFVVGTSTGLLKAFRIALALTGVGLLVIGVIALVNAFKSSNDEMERANELIDQQKNRLEGLNALNEQRTELELARARAIGAAESELLKVQGRSLLQRRADIKEVIKNLKDEQSQLNSTSEAWFNLNKQIDESGDEIRNIDNELLVRSINLEKQLADERAEALKKRIDAQKKANEEAAKLAKERRAAEFEDFRAGIELQLLATKEGSEEQLELRKKLMLATLQIDLDNEKLTNNQRKLLIQTFFKERTDIEKKFLADRGKFILEQIVSDIQAELQGLELSNDRKLELTQTAINLAAEMEIDAALGNGAKIAEINAKRDKAIRDARIASIQEVLDYELQTAEVANAATLRALNRRVADERTTLQERIAIIDEFTEVESAAIQKRIKALNEERKQGLISQKDYNLQYAQLVDEQTKVWEDAEAKKTEATKKAADERKQRTIQEIQAIVEAVTAVVDVLDSLFQLQSSRENESLNQQKAQLKDLQDAGAITEKEAITRQKRIEAEEKRIRQQQAERDKKIAVFKALLAIPQAVLQGLSQGGPILAAIYGALAALQAAIVIARPVPKFKKGKKDSYEGPGEVGEAGTEIVEKNGRMYVVDKPQVIWLGKKDKVYNPMETEKMLSKSAMNTSRPELTIEKKKPEFDYKKLGKEIGKHTSTTVYVDGYREQQIQKELFTRDLNKRRSW